MPRRHARDADDADGIAFVRLGLEDGAKKGHATATVAIYAGMTAAELQAVVHAALGLAPSATCVGFVLSQAPPQKHGKAWKERIVPLAVACVSPEVLQAPGGYARVLLAPSSTAASSRAASLSTAETSQRLQRLIAALRDDDRSLSSFEAAILAELCEQRVDDVLRVVQDTTTSLASKKEFLLSLVRSGSGEVAPVSARSPSGGDAIAETSGGSSAQIDLICKKVVSIAHTVFSPHVQSDLMTEASLYREKQRKLSMAAGTSSTRIASLSSAPSTSDASVSSIMELLSVVEKLLNKHALQEEQSVKLIRLILGENRILMSALQSYKLDYNLSELEGTIKRMAALGGAPTVADIPANASPKRSKGSPKKTSSPRRKAANHAALNGDRKNRMPLIVRPHDVLQTLYHKNMVTTLELDLLRALVNQHDAQVLAAVEAYESARNLEQLRDHLVSIVEEITVELGDEEKMEDAVSLGNWQESLIQLVQRWFSLRRLTADHVHVLRALIEDNHNLLQSAFEVFATDGDENELLDTLQRIAKLQVQANEGALIAAFGRIVDEHCDVLRQNEKALVKQLFARKNELARAAWEVFEVEQNVEDFGDTLLRIARFTTRQDAKLRLVEVVGEMMNRNLIRSHEADGLIRLYEEKNEAMIAANEAFESDSDVKELVETLLLIVKHANFGDAPLCSSPRNTTRGAAPTLTPPSSPSSDLTSLHITSSTQFDADSEAYFAARLIEILGSKGRLAKWQIELLLGLLARNDDRVFAIIDVYNQERDARELVDTLWRLCDLTAWEKNKVMISAQWIRPLEQNGRVAERGVLQKLVDARDDRLIAAFVVFLGDGNSEEFADTLVRLARLEGLKSGGANDVSDDVDQAPMDEDEKQELRVIMARLANDREKTGLSSEEIATIEMHLSQHDPATLAAFDVYRETLDSDDFVDTLKRILSSRMGRRASVTSRTLLMEKQLLHFATELPGIQPKELAVLKRSIARNDSIIEAAVEVYEAEGDEEDLKDTLKRIAVHLAASEKS